VAAEGKVNNLLRRVLVVTFVGVLLYGLFAVYAGVHQIGSSLAQFRGVTFLLALCLACLNYLLRFGKWQYYLARLQIRGIPLVDSLLVFLTGFVLTITPGKVGEVFKSAVLAKTHGIAAERTAPIVIADRLTDVIGIVLLIVIGGATFPRGLPWALAGGLAVGVGLVLILWQPPALWLCDRLEARRGRVGAFVPKLRARSAAGAGCARPALRLCLGVRRQRALCPALGLSTKCTPGKFGIFLLDRHPGRGADSGARRPGARRRHVARGAHAPRRGRRGRGHCGHDPGAARHVMVGGAGRIYRAAVIAIALSGGVHARSAAGNRCDAA
jgi:hypothetical protein